MSTDRAQRVQQHLARLENLDAARRLFADLNYDVTRQPLSRHDWPTAAHDALAEEPQLIAGHGDFHVIYARLTNEGRLLLTAEREVVNRLLKDYPFALFLFSDSEQDHWHFLNVKYEQQQTPESTAATRRIFRRISVGPYERSHGRLRTAAERLAMLDLETIDRDLSGIAPLAIQQRHDDAFDVERVTQDFFNDYRRIFEFAEGHIEGIEDKDALRLFTQRLFNRLMFVVFLERKGWLHLNGREDYLLALWSDHQQQLRHDPDVNFYYHRLKLLFFSGLNTKNEIDVNTGVVDLAGDAVRTALHDYIGNVPYLNGGLFEEDELDRADVTIPDNIFSRVIHELFYHYNFTVTESTPLDIEVAVDPEMLGRIFEELVTGRHESGSYYTPKSIVSFMGRQALKGYLEMACRNESPDQIASLVDNRDATQLRDPEAVLRALRNVTICDPACGSGAYLVGMLHELLFLRQTLFATRQVDAITLYDRKLEIIQKNLYGVDRDPFAINIARLRLWLSLVVDFDGTQPEPLPNLDFKIEVGDSLTGPDPSGGLQPDLFRQQQVKHYFGLKSDYMSAHGEQKRVLGQQIDKLRQEIKEWSRPQTESNSGTDGNGFDWLLEFTEVFSTAGERAHVGFDIVVANPPYLRQELIPQEYKQSLRLRFSRIFGGRADLYVAFYARALQLVQQDGFIAFISSNKFMRAGYGAALRGLLTHYRLVSLIDFGDLPIFDATTYPVVIVIQNQRAKRDQMVQVLNIDQLSSVRNLQDFVKQNSWEQRQSTLGSEPWALVNPQVSIMLDRLASIGRPLAQLLQGNVFTGVKTGRNAVFVIDNATRERLIKNDPNSKDLIKPWLRGRDVKRWKIASDVEYVIFTHHGIDIEQYPSIKSYLSEHRESLEKRATSHLHEWYELQQPQTGLFESFSRPKIVWPDIAKRSEFALDFDGHFIDMTLFAITSSDLFLLGMLNSTVINWWMTHRAPSIQNNYIRFKRQYVENIPIPEPSSQQRLDIEEIVRELSQSSSEPNTVEELEVRLNARVYELFNLSTSEVQIMEDSMLTDRHSRAYKQAAKALENLLEEQNK